MLRQSIVIQRKETLEKGNKRKQSH